MGLHPQTVRYRMRALQRTLDGQLSDPDSRFAIEAVLRAGQLRSRAAQAAGPDPRQPLIPVRRGAGSGDGAPQIGASPA
jgi:PucR C-terminal helix-turn-helix domain